MLKKVFTLAIALCIILFTSCVFATNNIGNSMMDATNTVRNAVGGAENVVEDAASGIGTGIRDLGNTFKDGAARVTNDANSMQDNAMNNPNNGYTATRTATTGNNGTVFGMSSNVWTWLILAVAAIAIVGLVWYYAVQNSNEYNDNH